MEDLLSAFDPYHRPSSSTSNSAPQDRLFSAEQTGSSSSSRPLAPATALTPTARVSLSDGPLDLLSFGDDAPPATRNGHGSEQTTSSMSIGEPVVVDVQAKAAARQEDILSELSNADQFVDWSAPSTSTSMTAHQQPSFPSTSSSSTARPTARTRRSSQGGSPPGASTHRIHHPPRRMSRSGLMHADSFGAFEQSEHHFPASTSPTGLLKDQAELFHPSSPKEGSALEAMRSNSYFASLGRSSGSSQAGLGAGRRRQSTSSNGNYVQTVVEQPAASTSGGQASSRTERTNAFAIPPPPSLSADSVAQNAYPFNLPSNDDLFLPKSSTSSRRTNTKPTSSASTSQQENLSPQRGTAKQAAIPKKQQTFDFSNAFGLGNSGSNGGLAPPERSSSSNRSNGSGHDVPPRRSPAMSAASSLTIDSEPLPPIKLKHPMHISPGSLVLTDDMVEGIRPALTSRLRLCTTWTLLYSLDAHGTSLATLYTKVQAGLVKAAGGCVLCIKDMRGRVFGGYVNEAFVKRDGYYGNGECFLWKMETFPPSETFRVGPIIRSFKWTGANSYLILSDGKFLSLGGGDGKFGLWIDSNLEKGFSTTCPAFANEVLCDETGETRDGVKEGKFEIMAIECWAVG